MTLEEKMNQIKEDIKNGLCEKDNREVLKKYFAEYTFETRDDAIKFLYSFGALDLSLKPLQDLAERNGTDVLKRSAELGLRDKYILKVKWDNLTIKIEDEGNKFFSWNQWDGWHEDWCPGIDENVCMGNTLNEAIKHLYESNLRHTWDYQKPRKIGLLTAGTGFGKTTFIENSFIDELNEANFVWSGLQPEGINKYSKKDILFITTRRAILDQQKNDGEVVDAEEEDFNELGTNRATDFRGDKVRIITTNKLGKWFNEGKIKKMFPIVVIDEIHSLFLDTTYASDSFNCLDCISHFWDDTYKFGLTATPELLLGYIDPEGEMFYLLEDNDLLSKYNTEEFIYCNYTYLSTIIDKINPENNKKVVVYSFSAKNAVKLAETYGGRFLIANDEEKYPEWVPLQQDLREYVIKNRKLPDDVNLVFMTSAYREGIELEDERIKIIIIDASDEITISQFLGRVRGNVEKVIVITNENQLERIERTAEEYLRVEKLSDEKIIEYYGAQMERINNKENQTLFVVKSEGKYKLNTLIKPIYQYLLDCYYQANNKEGNQIIKYGDRDLKVSDDWFNSWLKDYSIAKIKRIGGKQELNEEMANWKVIYNYLGKRLYAEQKEELITAIGLWDYKHNRPCKAKRVKELIREKGFVIEEKQDRKGQRYWIITMAF